MKVNKAFFYYFYIDKLFIYSQLVCPSVIAICNINNATIFKSMLQKQVLISLVFFIQIRNWQISILMALKELTTTGMRTERLLKRVIYIITVHGNPAVL